MDQLVYNALRLLDTMPRARGGKNHRLLVHLCQFYKDLLSPRAPHGNDELIDLQQHIAHNQQVTYVLSHH